MDKSASEWVRFCRLVPTYSVILGLDPRIHTQHSTYMSSRMGCPLPLRLSTASTMLGAWILGSSPIGANLVVDVRWLVAFAVAREVDGA
ncbi:hypothetical protein M2310_007403, partial [Rhizobium leguminosarum]|nr:hypothetical protein [Rhizobium esperanzae]MDH6206705.1 hypothetical protein [Rhizobium leguminosarum]